MNKNLIKRAVFVGPAVLVVILLASFLNKNGVLGPGYEVSTELYNSTPIWKDTFAYLRVTVTGPANDFVVGLITPKKESTTVDIEKTDMIAGFKTVSLSFMDVGSTNGVYTLVINTTNGKTIYKKKMDLIFDENGKVFERSAKFEEVEKPAKEEVTVIVADVNCRPTGI